MMPAILPALISFYAIVGTGAVYATGISVVWIVKSLSYSDCSISDDPYHIFYGILPAVPEDDR